MPIVIKRKPAAAPAPEPIVTAPKRSQGRVMDGMCRAAIGSAPMSIVPWFLMASYAYYVHDLSILSDGLYDELAHDMLATWDDIKHRHKQLITTDDLMAGTLFRLKEQDYPLMTRSAARHLIRTEWGIQIDVVF